jgi:4-hydroxy-tetrahydrodipicolinate synthase
MGGVGIISVLANALTLAFQKIKYGVQTNKLAQAQAAQFSLLDINGPMYEEGNPVGVKFLLSLMGVCEPHVRLPLVRASNSLQKKISQLYVKL